MSKPTLEEVLNYSKKKTKQAISDYAYALPREQQEEAEQESHIRVIEAYQRIDEGRNSWKSFISTNAIGAVIDYIKAGSGFMEDRKGKEDKKESQGKKGKKKRKNITQRVTSLDEDGSAVDVEVVAGFNGVFTEENFMSSYDIKWDLVSRMASVDTSIHMLAKIILGFEFNDLARIFNCTPEDISRRYRRFLKRLEMPAYARDPWIDQFIYAFGLSEAFNTKSESNGLAEDYSPVDLYSEAKIKGSKEIDGPAFHWLQDLIPDGETIQTFSKKIKWDLLAKMADDDEDILLIALILKGHTKLKLAKYFAEEVQNLKSRCLRFLKRLDSPSEYYSAWVKQIIYALGAEEVFLQERRDWGVGHYLKAVDFNAKKKKMPKGYQLTFLSALM